MGIEKNQGKAQQAFNNASNQQKAPARTTQEKANRVSKQNSSTVRAATPSPGLNGPKPPAAVRRSLDRSHHLAAQKKLAQKEKVKNYFGKSAHNTQKQSNTLSQKFNNSSQKRSR